MKSEIRENGRMNAAWLDKHILMNLRNSSEWFEALISLKCPDDPAMLATIGDRTTLTNKKECRPFSA